MPLGDIKPRELTPEEMCWRDRWEGFGCLSAEDNLAILWRMSRKEFFAFVYAMDPRSALILSTEPGYRDVFAYQRSKRWYHEIFDFVRRKFNGDC
jgi:hypothetical protein